jgi:tripartite-type tricarboxylate transporter receptor subunit TctC
MPALKRNLGYDALNDFAPVVLMADAPLVLLVREDLPVRSVAEFLDLLRDRPGQLNYATGGFGSPHYLATMTLFYRAGLPRNSAVHVPFNGLVPALTSVLAGNAQFMIGSTGLAGAHIASGKLRALAITSLRRSPRLPEIPTMVELGFPGFEVLAWCGLAAPAGTPDELIDRWNELVDEALGEPKLREQIAAMDYDVRGGTSREFARFLAADIERYEQLVQAMDLAED